MVNKISLIKIVRILRRTKCAMCNSHNVTDRKVQNESKIPVSKKKITTVF